MILAIVQARMGSTRLPGKVMREVLGKPLIGYLLERLKLSRKIDRVIIATSTDPANDILCDYLEKQGVGVYRGSENDVLDRFYQAALKHGAKTVVRITADCPLIDYKIVDRVIGLYESDGLDYASTAWNAPGYPDGLDAEVFSFNALETAWKDSKKPSEREHVTPYIKTSERFRIGILQPDQDYSGERWTVDNEEDFIVIKDVLEALYRPERYFGMEEVLDYKRRCPEVFQANRHLKRNEGYAKSLEKDRELEPPAGSIG